MYNYAVTKVCGAVCRSFGERSFQERQGCLLAPLLGFRDGLKAAFHSVCVRCCLSLRSDVFSLSSSAMEAWQMLGAELPGEQEVEMLITFRYDSGWLRDILCHPQDKETHLLLLWVVWIGFVWVESLGSPSCLVPSCTRTRSGVQVWVKEGWE